MENAVTEHNNKQKQNTTAHGTLNTEIRLVTE